MSLFEFLAGELISEQQARAITAPYWVELNAVWSSAWEEWGKIDERQRARLGETPCTPPVVLNAFAQSFARERFRGREDEGLVECAAIPNVFVFYINHQVLLRFNGLGTDFVVHNTDKSVLKDNYFQQEPIAGIDKSATRLTVGYVCNETKTHMACVAISLQMGPDPVYHFLIDGSGEGTLSIPAPIVPPVPLMPSEQLSKAKPR
jgi:hypothetical protein